MSGSVTVRLNKLGMCSRREAAEYIRNGWVRVNGQVVETPGEHVDTTSSIELHDKAMDIIRSQKTNTIILHKRLGVVSCQPEGDLIPAVKLLTNNNYYRRRTPDSSTANEPWRLGKLAVAVESELQEFVASTKARKSAIENHYRQKLKTLSKEKEKREYELKKNADAMKEMTEATEVEQTWKVIKTFQTHIKEQALQKTLFGATLMDLSKQLESLSKDFTEIKEKIKKVSNVNSFSLGAEEQMNELRQLQVNNDFLHAKETVLENKLQYLKIEKQKHAWVDSVLRRIIRDQMLSLKEGYESEQGDEWMSRHSL